MKSVSTGPHGIFHEQYDQRKKGKKRSTKWSDN